MLSRSNCTAPNYFGVMEYRIVQDELYLKTEATEDSHLVVWCQR
jgi:hypothetical protein